MANKTLLLQSVYFLVFFFGLTVAVDSSANDSDPYFSKQKALQYAHLEEAMSILLDAKTLAAEPVLIGVIDKGPINRQHPDFAGVILPESETNSADKYEWHGQYVTGILAARAYNNIGTRGAIGTQARIIYRQVSSADDIVYSIGKLAARGVAVINMSLGVNAPCAQNRLDGDGKCQEPIAENSRIANAIENALKGSNTIVVISAGNDHEVINSIVGEKDGLIVVGGMNSSGTRASYSNYGPGVSLFAPDFGVWGLSNSGYVIHDPATSFTTPLVTAAAAWAVLYLKAHDTKFSAGDVKNLILKSTQPQKGLMGKSEVAGSLDYLNLAHALQTFVQVPQKIITAKTKPTQKATVKPKPTT